MTGEGRSLAQAAAAELGEIIRRRTGTRSLFEWEGDTLHVLVGEDSVPALSATRHPDGRVSMDWERNRRSEEADSQYNEQDPWCDEPDPWYDEELDCDARDVARHAVGMFIDQNVPWVEKRVQETAIRENPEIRRMDRRFLRQRYPGETRRGAAQAAIEAMLLRTVGKRPAARHRQGKAADVLAREWARLLDDGTAREASAVMDTGRRGRRECSMGQYNAFVLHQDAIRRLREEAPAAAMAWWRNIATQAAPGTPPGAGPEDLAKEVRKLMGARPAEWRIIMGLGNLLAAPMISYEHPEDLQEITHAARTIVSAGVPDPCPALAAGIMTETHQSHMTAARQGDQGRRHWVWAVRQAFMEHPREGCPAVEELERMREDDREWAPYQTPCGQYATTLFHIANAIEWRLRNGERWRNSNWRNLLRQAAAWVDQLGYDDDEIPGLMAEAMDEHWAKNGLHDNLSWHSLIGRQEIGRLILTPVTNSLELHHLGRAMRNCLPYYGEQCAQGESRIFSIHLPGGTLAGAGEITRRTDPDPDDPAGNEWRGGEVEVTGQETSWYSARMAIEEIADLYTAAERSG